MPASYGSRGGELLPPGPGRDHRRVQAAEPAVVVDGQGGRAAHLVAHAARPRPAGGALDARDPGPDDGAVVHGRDNRSCPTPIPDFLLNILALLDRPQDALAEALRDG